MSNEEKFKNKIKGLLEEQSFPYDSDNWEIASTELDNTDKRKRRFIIWFLCGLGLLATVYFLEPTKILQSNEYAQSEKVKVEAVKENVDPPEFITTDKVRVRQNKKTKVRAVT